MKTFLFFIVIFLIGCTSEYFGDTDIESESRIYLFSILSPNEKLIVKYHRVIQQNDKIERQKENVRLYLLENDIIFDTLKFIFEDTLISQFSGKIIGFQKRLEFNSSKEVKFPKNNNRYSLLLREDTLSRVYSFSEIPILPSVDSVVLESGKFKLESTRVDCGKIFMGGLDNLNYLAFYGKYRILNSSSKKLKDIDVRYDIDPQSLCGSIKSYLNFGNYSTVSGNCISKSNNIISFKHNYFSVNDSLVEGKMIVCNVANQVAEFYGEQELFFEGTEFFFAPSKKINFNIDNDRHLGLLGCINCLSIPIKIK
jgi:hypothetical protein